MNENCTVYLRDKSNEKTGTYRTQWGIYPADEETSDYLWSEGNYSCDHNRVLFLYGHDSVEAENEEKYNCASNLIIVDKIVHDDGRIVYDREE